MAILEIEVKYGGGLKLCDECWATFFNDKWHNDIHDEWMGSARSASEKIRVESNIKKGDWTIISGNMSPEDTEFRVTSLF